MDTLDYLLMRFALNRYESLTRKITVRVYKQTFKNKILTEKKRKTKQLYKYTEQGKTSDKYAEVDQNNNATESSLVTTILTINNYTLLYSAFSISFGRLPGLFVQI